MRSQRQIDPPALVSAGPEADNKLRAFTWGVFAATFLIVAFIAGFSKANPAAWAGEMLVYSVVILLLAQVIPKRAIRWFVCAVMFAVVGIVVAWLRVRGR